MLEIYAFTEYYHLNHRMSIYIFSLIPSIIYLHIFSLIYPSSRLHSTRISHCPKGRRESQWHASLGKPFCFSKEACHCDSLPATRCYSSTQNQIFVLTSFGIYPFSFNASIICPLCSVPKASMVILSSTAAFLLVETN